MGTLEAGVKKLEDRYGRTAEEQIRVMSDEELDRFLIASLRKVTPEEWTRVSQEVYPEIRALRDPENSTIAEVWQSVPGWMMGAAGVDMVGVVAWLDILLASAPALPGGSGPLLDMARRPHERAHGRHCYGPVDKQPGSRYVIGKSALAA